MSQSSILNADMATMAGWLNGGVKWWLEELTALVPARLKRPQRRRVPLAMLDAKGARLQWQLTYGRTVPGEGARRADLALPVADALTRELVLPAMSLADLRAYVALERDRLFPLPGATLLFDAELLAPAEDGRQRVRIGAVRREQIALLVEKAADEGIAPLRIGLFDPAAIDHPHLDFAAALRAEGALPHTESQRQIWWVIVAGLALFNIGLLVWRDQQSVANLQAVVDAQQGAVRVYRAIAGRNAEVETLASRGTARRQLQRPLGDLATTSAALPPNAWVQRYVWTGRTIQLAGYAKGDSDLIAALRQSPRFGDVRATNGDVQADIPMGRPFDFTIALKGRPQ